MVDHLKAEIDERVPDLVAMRRDLHEHPELAFEEVRTSNIVAQRLQALGLDVRTNVAKTGVVGLLRGGAGDAKTIAIRADMDALPIHELNEIDYRSTVDGKMHACGHDGHTSILLTVADILSKRQDELTGNVKFIFQPAEEQIGGAEPMVKEGALEGVDSIIGLHLISTYPVGRIGVRAGAVFASANRFEVKVQGRGGHAAMPHEAVDPIVIAAYITTALQTLISRQTSPFSPAVITIGTIHAGSAFNIIPEQAILQGTMRAFSQEHREFLIRRIDEVAQGVSTAMGGSCTVEWFEGCPPCVNDLAVTAVVHGAAIATVGKLAVDDSEEVDDGQRRYGRLPRYGARLLLYCGSEQSRQRSELSSSSPALQRRRGCPADRRRGPHACHAGSSRRVGGGTLRRESRLQPLIGRRRLFCKAFSGKRFSLKLIKN